MYDKLVHAKRLNAQKYSVVHQLWGGHANIQTIDNVLLKSSRDKLSFTQIYKWVFTKLWM